MRRFGWSLAGLVAFLPGIALADDCSKDVLAAVEKQRSSKAFRVSMTQGTVEGPVDMTVDYLPPDRMLQTVTAKHMAGPQQTMLVGTRAFAGSDGAYEELLPQFAQSVVSEMANAVGKPDHMGTFECVGKQTVDGKEFLAYRAVDKDAKPGANPDETLARTIYVDPANGLPAYNIVAAVSGKGEPALKVTYSYPTDLVIEAPEGAPIQKIR
ncbi:MAG: hypothetical protein IKE66_05990 [Hyphomicrobium sp.]|nr:hypothetical protein [Hyphomicrobium sp.]